MSAAYRVSAASAERLKEARQLLELVQWIGNARHIADGALRLGARSLEMERVFAEAEIDFSCAVWSMKHTHALEVLLKRIDATMQSAEEGGPV